MIWKSVIDAYFICQYCLPDIVTNLIHFNFYISSHCPLLPTDIQKITNSFQIHPLFIDHHWTNVECVYDPIRSYQHIFSSTAKKIQLFDCLTNHTYIFQWPHLRHIWINLHPSLYLFLERLNEIFPNVFSIAVNMGKYFFALFDDSLNNLTKVQ
ncbi:unnamed protein product [Rotaria sordida]|uniref:Uncharacterized protein n=1 Tax=Rotaria sordida TaxID=392033 RepID=A0A815QT10_9BILA|nr:unnamed protein product [Rotaria sordida]